VNIRKRVAGGPAVASVFAEEILQILSNLNLLDALPESDAVLCVRVRNSEGKVHTGIAYDGSGIDPSIMRICSSPTVRLRTRERVWGYGCLAISYKAQWNDPMPKLASARPHSTVPAEVADLD